MTKLEKMAHEYTHCKHVFGKETAQWMRQEAYIAGFKAARELAIDRVKYCSSSIILRDDDFTRGYLTACEDIQQKQVATGD